jgi:nucleotide-binding universal stress UspA family protein
MYDRILVATDGSDAAGVAADAAIELARRFGAEVRALYVRESGAEDGTAERATGAVTERAAAAGVDSTATIVDGGEPIHRTVLTAADEHDADCIVMGTRGRTGLDRFVLGSVAERTLRTSPVPVLTVHAETVIDRDFDRILVPTDGSPGADAAAAHAIDIAVATGAALHVVHVVDAGVLPMDGSGAVLDELQRVGKQALDSVVERAKAADVSTVRASVLTGAPYRAITDYAHAEDVDLVVMGTHGRTGADRFLLGSVAERVVRLSDSPVLTLGED